MSIAPTVDPGWETLSDGVDILLRPDNSNDIVALIVFSPLGCAVESHRDAGIVSLTGRMLMRGTKRLSNAELADAVDSLGISLACDSSEDYSHMHVVTTSDALAESVALLSEIFFEPSFEPEELEKERQTTLAAIRRSDDDLLSSTLRHFYQRLYPDHGYGTPAVGLKESIGELTREQVINTHEELTSGPFRVVAVGNFVADEMRDLLRKHFISRMGNIPSERIIVRPPLAGSPNTTTLTRDSEQAYLVAGFPALAPLDPHYVAARVLNCVLGEGMSSRLFQALREDKGLAYATGSSYGALKLAGQMFGYIGTKPESLDTAREGMLAEFERIKNELVPDDELLRTKNYMVGRFLIDHQKNFKRAFYLGHFDQMGLGWQMDALYPGMIASVTAEKVQAVAKRILTEPVIVELRPTD